MCGDVWTAMQSAIFMHHAMFASCACCAEYRCFNLSNDFAIAAVVVSTRVWRLVSSGSWDG